MLPGALRAIPVATSVSGPRSAIVIAGRAGEVRDPDHAKMQDRLCRCYAGASTKFSGVSGSGSGRERS